MADLEDALLVVYGRLLILGLWVMAQRSDSVWTFEITE